MCDEQKSTGAGKESSGAATSGAVEIIINTVLAESKSADDGEEALLHFYPTSDWPRLPFTVLIELITAEDTTLLTLGGRPLLSRHEIAGILFRSATLDSQLRFLNFVREKDVDTNLLERVLSVVGK